MDRRWIHGALFTPQYICGVRSFMKFVKDRFSESEQILCPCSSCLNTISLEQNEVERHLLLNGMSSTYTRWIDHGEDRNIHVLEEVAEAEDANDVCFVPEHTNGDGGLEDIAYHHAVCEAEKYKNEPPNALELFKETHYSKKKGFSLAVQSLVVEIEDNLNQPVDEALEPKDVTEVLSEALVQKTKKNIFLVNVGLKRSATRGSAEYDLQEELVVEKQTSSDLREIVKTQQQQMDEMMKKLEEKEAAMAKREEESNKREANIDALIKTFMSMVPGDQATQ